MNDKTTFSVSSHGLAASIDAYSPYDAAVLFAKSYSLGDEDLIEVDYDGFASVWRFHIVDPIITYERTKRIDRTTYEVTR